MQRAAKHILLMAAVMTLAASAGTSDLFNERGEIGQVDIDCRAYGR